MARLHLIEIHEQSWCPASLREGLRDGLFTAWKLFFWRNTLPHLRDLLAHSEVPRIVDLCSGSGGPVPLVTHALAEDHPTLSVTLTDLFPAEEWNNPLGDDPRIGYAPEPVDATAVPQGLGGCRTLFEAFHHFRPDDAVGILSDAVRAQQPIAVFEFQRRSIKPLLQYPLNVLSSVGFLHLFHTPFRWKKLLFTVVPAIPLLLTFDGFVSILRTYTTEELAELARRAGCEGYRWEVRQSRDLGRGLMTCLIGWPDEEGGVHVVDYPR